MNKLQSRKFWISVAAFLASLGTGIAGLANGHESIAIAGGICTVLSAAIYAACEAYIDGASVKSSTQVVTISASSTAKDIVTKALNQEESSHTQ